MKPNLDAFSGSLFDQAIQTPATAAAKAPAGPAGQTATTAAPAAGTVSQAAQTPATAPATRGRTVIESLRQQIVRDEVALQEGGWGSDEFFRDRLASYRAEIVRLETSGPPKGHAE